MALRISRVPRRRIFPFNEKPSFDWDRKRVAWDESVVCGELQRGRYYFIGNFVELVYGAGAPGDVRVRAEGVGGHLQDAFGGILS